MMSHRNLPWLATLFFGSFSTSFCQGGDPAPTANSITVLPKAIELRHQRQPHLLQVLGASADGYSLDLHRQTKFASADPRIATVDAQGWVRPLANGQTQVTITVAGQTRSVPVKVQLPVVQPSYSFRHEVM